MIIKILLVWFLLTLPIVRTVLKQMEEQNRPERNSILFQIVLILQSMIYVPHYYFLVVLELVTKPFKRK